MAVLTPVEMEPVYNLSLTLDELGVLYTILHFVGGNKDKTDRKHTDSIFDSIKILQNSLRQQNIQIHLSYDRNKIKGNGIEFE